MRATTRLYSLGAVAATAAGAFFVPVPIHTPIAAAAMPASPDGAYVTTAARSAAPPARIVVVSGDTLSGLAPTVGRTWPQLAGWNRLADPNRIMPGEVLQVPPADYRPPVVHELPAVPASVTRSAAPAPVVVHSAPAPAYTPPPPAPAPAQPVANLSGVWGCIAQHESGGNPAENTGNGYSGMYQFSPSSWAGAGGLTYAPAAWEASAGQQLVVAEHLQQMQGWGAWPVTSRMCGV